MAYKEGSAAEEAGESKRKEAAEMRAGKGDGKKKKRKSPGETLYPKKDLGALAEAK